MLLGYRLLQKTLLSSGVLAIACLAPSAQANLPALASEVYETGGSVPSGVSAGRDSLAYQAKESRYSASQGISRFSVNQAQQGLWLGVDIGL